MLFKIALKNFYANNEIEFTQRHVNSVPYSSNILHICMKKFTIITLVYTFNCFDIQFQYIFYKLRNYKYIRFPCHFPFFKWFVRQLSRAFRAQMHKDHLSLYTFIQLLDSTYDCSSLKFLLLNERRSRRWIITRWTSYSVSVGRRKFADFRFGRDRSIPIIKTRPPFTVLT